MEQTYQIAGLLVAMDTFGRTKKQAEPYRKNSTEDPDIRIESMKKIYQERNPQMTEEDAEYLGTGSSFYRKIIEHDGMMLHASAVVVEGKAYLFSANSGTGKSTHTALWLKLFGKRAFILNDDKPALRYQEGTWYAYGTPWSGKNDISTNIGVPLAGIALLERSENNEIYPSEGPECILPLFRQTIRPKEMGYRITIYS